MTRLKFFGGVDEIGGNRILLEDKDTRMLLDYGMSFSKCGEFFEDYLKPRFACTGIKDLLVLELLPYIDGLYRPDLLRIINKTPHQQPSIEGVLLSHIHQDHSAYVSLLDERIPVSCSETTQRYAKALLESGRRGMETEICDYKCRPITDRKSPEIPRILNLIESEKPFKIDSIEVRPFNADHSILGAMAFLIHASDETIVYTGDLRLNGVRGTLTQKFINETAKEKVDTLICEGTRIDETQSNTENHVEQEASRVVSQFKGLVVADFAYKDVDRFLTFYNVAKSNGRRIAITKKHAHLIDELHAAPDGKNIPRINDENILIYIDRKKTGRYDDHDYEQWEKRFISLPNAVTAESIRSNQGEVLICLSFYDINELIDIEPNPGSIYIHSTSEPHNEEELIDEKRLHCWLDFFKLDEQHRYHFHASGHASGPEIQKIVQTINPKKVIPIHTLRPQLFQTMHSNIQIPSLERF